MGLSPAEKHTDWLWVQKSRKGYGRQAYKADDSNIEGHSSHPVSQSIMVSFNHNHNISLTIKEHFILFYSQSWKEKAEIQYRQKNAYN